jgi:hypothetical protein
LLDDRVGEDGGSREEQKSAHPNVTLRLQLAEHLGVQTTESEVKKYGEQSVGIIVKVIVLVRGESVLGKSPVTANAYEDRTGHVQVEEKIAAKNAALEGTHHHEGLKKSPH